MKKIINKKRIRYPSLSEILAKGASTSGAESFFQPFYGWGGVRQLAKGLNPATQHIENQEQSEIAQNVEDQMWINRKYPAPQSITGFVGGDTTGIRSGMRYPAGSPPEITASPEELELELEEEYNENDVKEAYIGLQPDVGPGRSVPSDGFYRNLQGYPRHNTIQCPKKHVMDIEGDLDGDGEEDEYLDNSEYVRHIEVLNGIKLRPDTFKKIFGVENYKDLDAPIEETTYVSPSYFPEPNKSIERYKQGKWIEDHEPDPTRKLMQYVDRTGGHAKMSPAKHSPGRHTYGQIGWPKDFIPDDWAQRHYMTSEEASEEEILDQRMQNETIFKNMKKDNIKNFVDSLFSENPNRRHHMRYDVSSVSPSQILSKVKKARQALNDLSVSLHKTNQREYEDFAVNRIDFIVNSVLSTLENDILSKQFGMMEDYTGMHDDSGEGEPKGGSEVFAKSRKKVLDDLLKNNEIDYDGEQDE